MKKFFEAAGALFPHMALVVCFASGAITFGVAPGLRVPLLFLSFSSLSLFWIFNLRFVNKNILYLITFGVLYLFLFVLFGLVRDQETTSNIFNIIFTGIAGGFFVNGVLWGGSKHFRSKNSNMLVLISAPILIAILAKSTAGYTSYMQLAISMVGGGRELSLDTGNPVGVAYANAISAICFLFLAIYVKNILFRALYLIGVLLCFYIVVSTASRGAFLYLILTSLLFLLANLSGAKKFLKSKKFFNNILYFLSFSLFSLLLAFILFKDKLVVLFDRFAVLAERFSSVFEFLQGNADDRSTSGRFTTYEYHLETFFDWIWLGQFQYIPYPHNLFLEILMRIGIIGVPLIIVIVLVLLKNLLNLFNKNYYKTMDWYFFYFLYCFCFMQSMTSLSMEINRGIWLSLGFLIAYRPTLFNSKKPII